MNINDAFPGTYLKASDLGGQARIWTIDRVEMVDVGMGEGTPEFKPVLYVNEQDRGIVLNKTNSMTLASAYNSVETDDWAGCVVEVYPDKTTFQGRLVDCIRMRSPHTPARPNPVVDAAAAVAGGGEPAVQHYESVKQLTDEEIAAVEHDAVPAYDQRDAPIGRQQMELYKDRCRALGIPFSDITSALAITGVVMLSDMKEIERQLYDRETRAYKRVPQQGKPEAQPR